MKSLRWSPGPIVLPMLVLTHLLAFGLIVVANPAAAQRDLKPFKGRLLDLVTVPRGGQDQVAVFYQRQLEDGPVLRWAKSSPEGAVLFEQPLQLWSDTIGYDVCQLADQKEPELIFLRPDGVYRLGSSAPVVRTPSLLPAPEEQRLQPIAMCFDLQAGQPAVVAVPQLGALELWRSPAGKNLYQKVAQINRQPKVRFWGQPVRQGRVQRLYTALEFPDTMAADVNGDGLNDLCALSREALNCVLQQSETFFSEPLATLTAEFSPLTEAEKQETGMRVQGHLLDVNGDGRTDVVFNKAQYRVTDMKGEVQVYLQDKIAAPGQGVAYAYPQKPDQVIKREGYFGYVEFIDFDQDGDLDLMAPTADLSWSSLVGAVLSREVDLEFLAYPNSGGKFGKATVLREYSYPVDFRNFRNVLGSLPRWHGRYFDSQQAAKQVLFFPDREKIVAWQFQSSGKPTSVDPLWQVETVLGQALVVGDFDGDNFDEIMVAGDQTDQVTLHYHDPRVGFDE